MDELTKPEVNPEIQRMTQALIPEYLRQNNEPIQWPSQPGKMKAVDPMNPAPWLTADIAGNLATMGMGKVAPAVFVGAKAMGNDLKAWEFAHALLQGAKREPGQGTVIPGINDSVFQGIHGRTGLHPGLEGWFRREVVDSPMKIKDLGKGPLGDMVEHPELFDAYPDLKHVPVKLYENPTYAGTTKSLYEGLEAGGPNDMARRTVLSHELQHAIQRIEGLPQGGNPISLQQVFYPKMPFTSAADKAENLYNRLAGEVEARNVHKRFENKTPSWISPWKTEDVSRRGQWVPGSWLEKQTPEMWSKFKKVPGAPNVPSDYQPFRIPFGF